MSGNNMLRPNCGKHHHTVEHDTCAVQGVNSAINPVEQKTTRGKMNTHKELIAKRAVSDPEYADSLFILGVKSAIEGDTDVAKSIIEDSKGITLDNESFDRIVAACRDAADPNEALKAALEFCNNTNGTPDK